MRKFRDYSTSDGQRRMMAESMGLPSDTYLSKPAVRELNGDYGFDPLGDDKYRMIPSGDIVSSTERDRRLME